MSFPFNNAIPATGHSPSLDYEGMQINNASTYSILAVDHFTFGNSTGGQHIQCQFPGIVDTPPVPTSSGSVLYPARSTADGQVINVTSLYFDNAAASFIVNPVKVFASVQIPQIPPNTTQSVNSNNYYGIVLAGSIDDSTNANYRRFTINLEPGVINSANSSVFISFSGRHPGSGAPTNEYIYSYSLTSTVLTIDITKIAGPSGVQNMNIMILQA